MTLALHLIPDPPPASAGPAVLHVEEVAMRGGVRWWTVWLAGERGQRLRFDMEAASPSQAIGIARGTLTGEASALRRAWSALY